MKKIIEYFSKSTAKTLTLLFMVLGIALLSLPSNQTSDLQNSRIAEEDTLDSEEQNFVNILNEHRAELGLSELEVIPVLNEAAEWMVNDLLEKDNPINHIDSEGRNPQKRLQDFGYNHSGGENLALSGPSGQDVFNDWMDSEDHKETMENPQWKAIGVKRLQGANPGTLWVANFGDTIPAQNEDEKNEASCGPEDRSDSGEFDNECKEILDCESDGNRGTWCLCEEDSQCVSQKCSEADVDNKKFCEEGPAPTEEQEEDGEENENKPTQEVTVNLIVTVPGVGGDPWLGQNINPVRKTRGLLFQFVNENEEIIYEAQGLLTYNNGVYTGVITAELPQGEYTLKIATDNSLFLSTPRVIGVGAGDNTYTIPRVSLVTGNISQNDASKNVLDLFDYNELLSCYGGKSCSTPDLSDLNEDGKVDSLDFNILLRGFAVQ